MVQRACVVQVRCTHREPYMGIAPTGKQVSFMLLLIERIVEGHIVEYWPVSAILTEKVGTMYHITEDFMLI
jgi:predicted ester cyclase